MGRKSTASMFNTDLSTPKCLKPLSTNKKIDTYLITRCTEGTSDKVYIFVVAKYKKQKVLARFWGKFGYVPSGMHTLYDQKEFQALIDEKARTMYKIVSDARIMESEVVYAAYANEIVSYIDNLARIPLGVKAQLSSLNL